jgi:hypothetical protein
LADKQSSIVFKGTKSRPPPLIKRFAVSRGDTRIKLLALFAATVLVQPKVSPALSPTRGASAIIGVFNFFIPGGFEKNMPEIVKWVEKTQADNTLNRTDNETKEV